MAPQAASSSAPALDPALAAVVASLQQRLQHTGELDKLNERLRAQLDRTSWREDLRKHARDKVIEANGQIDSRSLGSSILPHARDTLPDHIKDELATRLREFVENNVE